MRFTRGWSCYKKAYRDCDMPSEWQGDPSWGVGCGQAEAPEKKGLLSEERTRKKTLTVIRYPQNVPTAFPPFDTFNADTVVFALWSV